MDEIPMLELPSYKGITKARSYHGTTHTHEFSSELREMFYQLNSDRTFLTTVMTVVYMLFFKYTGIEDIVLGTVLVDRTHSDLEDQVGPYIDTLPIRVHFKKEDTFMSLSQRVNTAVYGAMKHREYSIECMLDELGIPNSNKNLFQVLVEILNHNMLESGNNANLDEIDLKVNPVVINTETANYNLSIYFTELKDSLLLNIRYNSEMFSQQQIEFMCRHMEAIVCYATDHKDAALNEYELLLKAEYKLLNEFNQASVKYSNHETVIQIIHNNCRNYPDKIAVSCDGNTVTYGEQFERSNQIARFLIDNGVRHDDVIAIIMDRSMTMLLLLSSISGIGNTLIILIINYSVGTSSRTKLILFLYLIFAVILYVGVQRVVRERIIKSTTNIVFNKRIVIIKKLLGTSYEEFEKIEEEKVNSTFVNDTEVISDFVNIVISTITSFVTLTFCMIYLGIINISGLFLAIVIIILISIIYFFYGNYADKIGNKARKEQDIIYKFIHNLVDGFKELKINTKKAEEFSEDMIYHCNEYKDLKQRTVLTYANMFIIGELLFTIAIIVVAFLFPIMIKNLTTDILKTYIFILLYITGPVNNLIDSVPNLLRVRISWSHINELVNRLSTAECSESSKKELTENRKEMKNRAVIQLEDITYHYKNGADHQFGIGPIQLELKMGEITFITGGYGCGKSTLAKVISGLYQPTNGKILMNGNEIDSQDLKNSFSYVHCDFHLFEKLYGINWNKKEKETEFYLDKLNLTEKVKVENGYFSTLSLSTGQRKRLALLVCYLEDKPFVLFDEWAASQDPYYRQLFYEDFLPDLKKQGKCVIAITHDDSYFGHCDQCIKLGYGKIVPN